MIIYKYKTFIRWSEKCILLKIYTLRFVSDFQKFGEIIKMYKKRIKQLEKSAADV